MKQRQHLVFLFAAILLGSGSAWSAEYLVKYKNGAGAEFIQNTVMTASNEFSVLGAHEPGSYVVVDIKHKDKVRQAKSIARFLANPNIEWVVPNFELRAIDGLGTATNVKSVADVKARKEQWAIAKIQAEKAWEKAGNKGRKNVVIAVIDTGVDYNHPNLAPNMVPGYDFKGNDSDPMDEVGQNPGHGTHCAGIAAATGLVDGGVIGSGPDVSVMPIRFLGADGSGDLNAAIRSVDFAIEKKVQVISASWGAAVARSQAQPLIEAVKRADDAGIIFVAAAANDGANNDTRDMFPANANTPNMIAVAASGPTDAKPSWSNYGKAMVHVSSPGEKIMSTLPGNKYGELSGTSMATPLVSGIVAFLKSQDASLTGAQIRALLQSTGTKVDIETACNCRVDALGAMEFLTTSKAWLVPAAAALPEGGSVNVAVKNGQAPFKFVSSNPSVVTVDDSGAVKAAAKGTAKISVTDAAGAQLTSLDFLVGSSSGGGSDPGQPGQPPGDGSCPIGDQAMCDIICGIQPDLPFCQ